MDTAVNYLYGIISLLLPLIVSAFPLLTFTGLSRLKSVADSAPMLALSTLGSVLIGCLSSGLAVLLSAGLLAHGMKGDGPKCVTGAVMYMMIGGFFTLMTLLIGFGMAGNRAFHRQL